MAKTQIVDDNATSNNQPVRQKQQRRPSAANMATMLWHAIAAGPSIAQILASQHPVYVGHAGGFGSRCWFGHVTNQRKLRLKRRRAGYYDR